MKVLQLAPGGECFLMAHVQLLAFHRTGERWVSLWPWEEVLAGAHNLHRIANSTIFGGNLCMVCYEALLPIRK